VTPPTICSASVYNLNKYEFRDAEEGKEAPPQMALPSVPLRT
jgi:hypothetical protein